MVRKRAKLSRQKAAKILKDNKVRGHKLTRPQQKYFGWVAGGSKPRKGRRKR